MKLFLRVFFFAALIAGMVWLWMHFHPSPQEAIRRRLAAFAEAASFEGPAGLVANVAAAQNFAGFFGREVRLDIEPRGMVPEEMTRQEIAELMAGVRARSDVRALRIQVLDPVITVGMDQKSAIVELTINAATDGERHLMVQEMKLTMKEVEGKWLILRLETVRTLNSVLPFFPADLPRAV